MKTRVIKKDVNPEWNEDLTLSVADPNIPVKLVRKLLCIRECILIQLGVHASFFHHILGHSFCQVSRPLEATERFTTMMKGSHARVILDHPLARLGKEKA